MGDKGVGNSLFYRVLSLTSVLLVLFLFNGKVCAQTAVNLSDSARTVRVAINDSGFKSLVFKQISVIATSDFDVFSKNSGKKIADFHPYDVVKISYDEGKFQITVNNKIIAKDLFDILVFHCPNGLLGVQNIKRVGRQAWYRGTFNLTPKNPNQFYLVNVLPLDDYLKGVVPNEMPVSFGLEALKAQAVAARNYVLMPRTRSNKEFDVDDSVASQVYFGAGTESNLASRAVNETNGLVALYGWNLILAQYCSTAGGYTESYENAFSDIKTKEFPSRPKPYLKGRPDIYDVAPLDREEEAKLFYMGYPDSYDIKSPYYRWQKTWDSTELKNVLQKTLVAQSASGFVKPAFKQGEDLGNIKEIKVLKRGVSGKVMEMEIVTDKNTYHLYKEIVVRRAFQKNGISMPSANVIFDNQYDADKKLIKVNAYGGGFGHGVGMSQFGAGFMATSLHKPFDKILKRYYTGISISTVPVILSANEGQKIVTQQFFAPHKKATVVVDNKYNIREFSANINGRNVTFELANSMVPIHRVSKIDISSYVKQGQNTITFHFPEYDKNKGIRVFVELIEKDESEYNF